MKASQSISRGISRREFLQTAGAAAVAGYGLTAMGVDSPPAEQKTVVGAHPWVYAATQPNYDITPTKWKMTFTT